LNAASELFAHKGFKGSTTRDIALSAGVTEITLYRHFKSKEDIFFEIIKNMSLLSIADELTKLDARMDIRNKLEHVGLKFIELFKKRSNEFRIMLSETITRPDMSKMFFETVPSRGIEMLAQMMRKEINAGNFAKADPKLLARAFIGMFLAYNLMQEIFLGKERDPYDDSEIAKFFTRIFLNGAVKN
jgi:AcrR family transcriptional regulator